MRQKERKNNRHATLTSGLSSQVGSAKCRLPFPQFVRDEPSGTEFITTLTVLRTSRGETQLPLFAFPMIIYHNITQIHGTIKIL